MMVLILALVGFPGQYRHTFGGERMKGPSKITVRRISKGELYLVRGLDHTIFGVDGCEAEEEEYSESKWWLAYDGDTAIGFSGALVYAGKWAIQLQRTGILRPYRGKGLQKRFIRTRLAYAKRLSVGHAHTYCADWNLASANSLISCGFKLYVPEWAYAGNDVFYFIKAIK
tara:strand:+ start:292 stop:804 length:513 start_codon:yes stop_codon:yes gene_type:complete